MRVWRLYPLSCARDALSAPYWLILRPMSRFGAILSNVEEGGCHWDFRPHMQILSNGELLREGI